MLVNNGVPSRKMQIFDVMGYVSVTQSDTTNRESLIESICRGMTRKQMIKLRDDIKKSGHRVPSWIAEQADSAEFMGDIHDERKQNSRKRKKGQAEDDTKETGWLEMWDGTLAKAVEAQAKSDTMTMSKATSFRKPVLEKKKIANIVGRVRGILAEIIADEIELDRVGDVRDQLATDHAEFEAALQKLSYIDAELRKRLITAVSTRDKHKLLTAPKQDVDPNETKDQKEVRETKQREEDASNLAAVGLARSLLGGAGLSPDEIKSKGGLSKVVQKMTPEARRMLVASYLDHKQRGTYLNPSSKVSVLNGLFDDAWEGGLRQDVEDALFTQDKINAIKKSQKEKKTQEEKDDVGHLKGKVVGIHSMLRFAGDAGPNYMALVEVSKNAFKMKVTTTTHGTRIWEIAQRAKGIELYQIRNDLPLLMRLRKLCKNDLTKPSVTNWDKFVDMMNLPATLKLKGAAKESPTTLDNLTVENQGPDGDNLRGNESLSEAYQAVADGVEFTPNYWVMHLHRLVKMAYPSTSDTYSVVTRAQIAAKRWVTFETSRRREEYEAELEQAEDSGDKPPKKPKKATEAQFMRLVFDAMKPEDQESVRKKVPQAYEALANGQHLAVDTRLERAKGWVLGGQQTSLNTNKAAVVASFEDLSGRELMDEWSNFAELRSLHDQRQPVLDSMNGLDPNDADDQEQMSQLNAELESVNDKISRYWPSINRAKLKYIEDNLAGGTRTEVLGMLATKLAGAMKGDSEFIQAAQEAGLTGDDYDSERLLFGHMMNKRRQLDTGLQYGTSSQFRAMQSIHEMSRNPLKFAEFIKNDGNKAINKSTAQNRKAQSNIYLAQVRNTQAQLDEARQDSSLSDDERREKVEQIRETGAEQIKESREELDRRNKIFTKARSELTKAVSRIVQILMVAAVTAATFGQGTAAVIIAMILSGIAREAGKALVTYAMQGDAYEHKDLAKAIIVGAVKGALRAATMELITVMDAASTLVDFTQTGIDGYVANHAYGNLMANSMIEAAMRSAVVDIPVNSVKYFFEAERPFRDFGRNLDVFLATNIVSVGGRQVAGIVGSLSGQAQNDLNSLFGASGPPPSGGVVQQAMSDFQQTSQQQVTGLVGRLAMLGKKAKIMMKAAATKLYGKYPQQWKHLQNQSLAAIRAQGLKEGEVDPTELPDERQLDRLMDLIDEIMAGNKTVDDVRKRDKEMLGVLIRYAESQGVQLP